MLWSECFISLEFKFVLRDLDLASQKENLRRELRLDCIHSRQIVCLRRAKFRAESIPLVRADFPYEKQDTYAARHIRPFSSWTKQPSRSASLSHSEEEEEDESEDSTDPTELAEAEAPHVELAIESE